MKYFVYGIFTRNGHASSDFRLEVLYTKEADALIAVDTYYKNQYKESMGWDIEIRKVTLISETP